MLKKAEKKLSIIIPVFNGEQTLPVLLESLRIKSGSCFEVIIINDGSTDNTLEVVKRFDAQVVHLPKCMGISLARNRGVKAASAPCLGFIDADCIAEPGWAQKILDEFIRLQKRDKSLAAMSGRVLPKQNKFIDELAAWIEHWEYQDGVVEARRKLSTSNCIVSKAAFEKIGGFDETLQVDEDRELALRLNRYGYTVAYNPAVAVQHNHNRRTLLSIFRHQWYWGYQIGLRNERKYKKERNLWFLAWISHPLIYFLILPLLCSVLTFRIVKRNWRKSIKITLAIPFIFIAKVCHRFGVLAWIIRDLQEKKA